MGIFFCQIANILVFVCPTVSVTTLQLSVVNWNKSQTISKLMGLIELSFQK